MKTRKEVIAQFKEDWSKIKDKYPKYDLFDFDSDKLGICTGEFERIYGVWVDTITGRLTNSTIVKVPEEIVNLAQGFSISIKENVINEARDIYVSILKSLDGENITLTQETNTRISAVNDFITEAKKFGYYVKYIGNTDDFDEQRIMVSKPDSPVGLIINTQTGERGIGLMSDAQVKNPDDLILNLDLLPISKPIENLLNKIDEIDRRIENNKTLIFNTHRISQAVILSENHYKSQKIE